MKKIIRFAIVYIMLLCVSVQVFAAGNFAATFAQVMRINAGADMAVALACDEKNVYDGGADVVTVREVDGNSLYEKLAMLVEEGGEKEPFLSGAVAKISVSDVSGIRTQKLDGLDLDGKEIDRNKKYKVVLSCAADGYFTDFSKIAEHKGNSALLAQYAQTFGEYEKDVNEEQIAAEEPKEEQKSPNRKLGDMLIMTVTLLVIVLIVYLYVKRKKKSE